MIGFLGSQRKGETNMAGHFFISYSRADGEEFALKLYNLLTAEPYSFTIWMDQHNLVFGQDWDDQIAEAIGSCQGVLFLMTKDSVRKNSGCKDEWTWALKYKKHIVPLLIDREAEIPYGLGRRQQINFTGEFEPKFAMLCKHLRWLPSPAGLLQREIDRLEDLERKLVRTNDPEEQKYTEEDITKSKAEIERLREIVNNPHAAARRVNESIARGIERERQAETPIKALARSKFINTPPREVPNYFQNRSYETKRVGSFLQDETKRLLTIVGRGGIGKTVIVCRLLKAIEIGQLPDDRGPLEADGIVYLSAIGSRRITALNLFSDLCKLLPDETAAELEKLYKNPQLSTEAKMETLLSAFPKGRIVLLLDNFEDIIETETRKIKDAELAESLQAILKLPPHAVKVIITTRVTATDLSLMNPERQMQIDLDKGLESPFAENILREMDADGKAGLKTAPDDLLAEARQRTRGFPRALEHLYAILSSDRDTSLQEILDDTKKLLPEKVMEVLVGEAFNRLDITTQQVMQALAVYSRPVSAVAVDYLLQPFVSGIDSAPVLKRLVNMQLVRKQEGRYYLHPIDREYALLRIPKGKETDRQEKSPPFSRFALWTRGADYFQQIRTSSDNWKTIEDLSPQLSEFDLRFAGQDFETAAKILLDIDFSRLYVWGYYRMMIELHSRLHGNLQDSQLREASLGNQGTALRVMGQAADALSLYQQALALARERRSFVDESVWLGNMGNCYQDMGQTIRAIECNEQSLAIKNKIGSNYGLAETLGNLGNCYGDLGETARSIDFHQKALDAARSRTDRQSEGLILSNLADMLIDEGKFSEALKYAKEGLKIGEQLNSPMICVYNLQDIARSHFYAGDLQLARTASEKTRQYDVPECNHTCLILLGVIALRQGEQIMAQEVFNETIVQADLILKESPQYFQAWGAKGIALCGLTLCGNIDYTAAATEAFRSAREVNSDAGIVSRAVRLFDALAILDTGGKLSQVREAVVNLSKNL